MKRMFGFVIPALSVLMYVPSVAAQTSQAQTAAQTSTQDSQAPTPHVVPDRAVPPRANNWLLSYWYCVPADCFDIVVAQQYGQAYTAAYGTCYGTPFTGAYNPTAIESIVAENCEAPTYLETGTATFRLTTMKWFSRTYGLEGLIVPAQATTDGGVAIGYSLQWCNNTGTTVEFVVEC